MAKTLADIAAELRQIDFCMLTTRAQDGSIAGRPMSNNQEVDYDGDSRFFSYDDTHTIADIGRDASVGLSYRGAESANGAPGLFVHIEGEAELVRDKAAFAQHWDPSLDRWFPDGVDTQGLVMIAVKARRLHYWDGEDEGEVKLPAAA